MKIVIIYHAGGMRNALEIYSAMAVHPDMEITAIIPNRLAIDRVYDPSGWLEVKKERELDGYRLVPVPLVDPCRYTVGFENEPLRRVMGQTRPDIVHVWDEPLSHCLYHIAWLRLLASHKSRVLFYGFQNTPYKWDVLGRVIWKFTWMQVAGGAAANSEALSVLRQAGFPRRRPMERIFWGIPTDLFKPMDKVTLKQDLKLECDYVVGYVGRLVPEKGLLWFLAAMRQLPPRVHCLIIGSGPMRGELELWSELPSLAGRVHLLDAKPTEELPMYLNCMDVLVVPSITTRCWKEQYGRVIGEAMACGVPVVGSDSGAIPEVMGSAGLIVQEGNTSELAKAVHTAVFDGQSRDRLKQEGLQRAQRELSIRSMAKGLLDFYGRVLGA